MSFCPLDHGSDSGACFLVCSIFLHPHGLVVVFYNLAFLNLSCKVFPDQVLLLLAVMGKIIAVSFLLLACPTDTERSAALGNVLLHFCRSRIWGYACSLRGKTRKFCNWELLWEQWLCHCLPQREGHFCMEQPSQTWLLRGIQLQWTSASVLCFGKKPFGFV